MTFWNDFAADECGAITVDWVMLTSALLTSAILVTFALLNGGVAPMVADVNQDLAGVSVGLGSSITPPGSSSSEP